MATTYKDYYIYYNGTYISGNEDTGLTAVNIYYNGSWIGEGAHTLYCGGQYMNGNITIGARTLYCSGQYMNGNVQVTTQNRYRWNKYYASPYYVSTYEDHITYEICRIQIAGPYAYGSTIYRFATGYTFDASNGNYTLSGGTQISLTADYNDLATIYTDGRQLKYCSYPGYGATTPIMFSTENHETDVDGNLNSSSYPKGILHAQTISGTSRQGHSRTWSSALQYSRGGHIGVVSSTNASAYSYGRNSDGYWYEAI